MKRPDAKIVLLLEGIHPDAVQAFERAGYQVRTSPKAMNESELIKAIGDVVLLGIRSKSKVTKKVLEAAPRLLAVGAFCIGTNQIDTIAAAERGIAVFNAPFSNTRSVVELTLAEMIMLLRRASDKNAKAHAGEWEKSATGCYEARGKTLGIIGYGHIGSQLSVLAEAMGMSVIFYDIAHRLTMGTARRVASLAQLLKEADIVTVHVDGRTENKHLIGAKQLKLMKRGSYLLNLSRGSIVDIDALAAALRSKHLAGAAVDVFPHEPAGNDEKFSSPLQHMANVILTPHVGGSTEEAQQDIGEFTSARLIDYAESGSTDMCINLPEIHAPILPKSHRIVHLHANVPGVLAQINEILASRGINIVGQYLKTDERTGYVITDIAGKGLNGAPEELAAIAGTFRSRVLY
jgi:D-3-phosphoglycerate dehydrogenase